MTERSSDDDLQPPTVSQDAAMEWVAAVFGNEQVGGILRYKELREAYQRALEEGQEIGDSMDFEDGDSHPTVILKNRLLGLIASISDRDGSFGGALIAQLEDRASLSVEPDKMRTSQLIGLIEVIASCFADENVRQGFEESADDILTSIRILKPSTETNE